MNTTPPTARNIHECLQSIAASTADAVSHLSDDDYRVYFLAVLDTLDWTATDGRWRAAMDLLRHDQPHHRDPISAELERLQIQIAVQGADMIALRGEWADREDLQKTSRDLRDATDRLCSIIYAATAVHSLGSVAS